MRAQDYETARSQLCPEQQRTHTVNWYEDEYSGSQVTDFVVHEDRIDVNLLEVPATVRRRSLGESVQTFALLQQTDPVGDLRRGRLIRPCAAPDNLVRLIRA